MIPKYTGLLIVAMLVMAALPACWAGGENEGESAGGACVAGGDFLATDSISARRSLAYERHQYVLPYLPGDNFLVVGGYNDWYTHYGIHALDWRMPEGTPILAARGGVVTEVVDHFAESGLTHEYFNRANYVVIRHEDNTCALYAHSPRQGIMVRAGDTVRAGQQIAVAGNTGFSVESHLHFEVYRMEGDSKVTLPTLFRSGAAEPLEIFRGAKYRAPHIAGIHDPALAGRFVPDADAVAAPPGAATTAQTAFGREFMAFRERLLQHARGPEPVAAARRVLRDLQESSGAANGLWRDLNRQATAGDRVAQGDLAVLMNAMSLEHEPDIARLQTDDNAAPVMDEAMILWWQMYAL